MTSLRQLHYFVTVAEEGQLTRAAQKLHLSQPALSQAIAQLESQLGVVLLERHARGVGLTAAGEAFFGKARAAVRALDEVDVAADSLSRVARQALECGFVGTPPMIEAPELFDSFAAAHPHTEVAFRELTFPCGTTSSALETVDVALYYAPTPHPDVDMYVIRNEPRYLVIASSHPFADRDEVNVAEVLDETFCGTHPACEPVRTGFWTLDDRRGAPARTSSDHAVNPAEVIAVVAAGRGIWTSSATTAAKVVHMLPGVTAVPLIDADPVPFALTWHRAKRNPHAAALVRVARSLASQLTASA